MPAVRESVDEKPAALEVVEVRPGVRLKLNAADKKALLESQAAAADQRREWNLVNAGGKVAGAKTAKETRISGPAVDGPVADDSEPSPDAEEAEVVAAPKPPSKTKK